MLGSGFFTGMMARLGRWCGIAVIVASFGLSGCKSLDSGANTVQEDPTFDAPRKLRPRDHDSLSSGLSPKARAVERDFGIQ